LDLKCTTILLIYNEEDNIRPQTLDILNVYHENDIKGEVLLVNDGSEDGSKEVCNKLASELPQEVRVIHHPKNLGRSYAIQTGFREAKGDVVIIMDADRQYEPKEIPDFLKKIDEGYDAVTGFRFSRADNSTRRFISRVYNKMIINGIFDLDIKDQNSGFKAFRRDVANSIEFNPDGYLGLHRYILPLVKIHGYSIAEIPITHYDRPAGSSYIKSYTVPFITLRDLVKFRRQHKDKMRKVKTVSVDSMRTRK
jgi:glycosyltransferase involved in cell wall biosynthesis